MKIQRANTISDILSMKLFAVLLICFLAFHSSTIFAQINHPFDNYIYAPNGDHERQSLRFYSQPAAMGVRPVLVFIHGGYWRGGSNEPNPIIGEIAQQGGMHLASITYRFATDTAPWPAPVQDVKTAVSWLKANASMLRIDPNAIVLVGESAGGHLAALAGLSGDRFDTNIYPGFNGDIAAVISLFGVYNMKFTLDYIEGLNNTLHTLNCGTEVDVWTIGELVDCPLNDYDPNSFVQCEAKLLEASPISYVHHNSPPIFTAHGALDCASPVSQAIEFNSELVKKGVVHKTVVRTKGEHSTDSLQLNIKEILSFLYKSKVPVLVP
ncbi:alpha/beta hydrolase [Vibrio sp. S4M6]|uniref:alpha/beta hydrolase n=1 Tax=Vibrio sinus TaxID=2946865 RepID=UPI00202A1E73|nr:alpha/beta hydrolase [Vibrio sinus]MCL9780272.1 alpha/beta hydrolase [Vibrio sinus]